MREEFLKCNFYPVFLLFLIGRPESHITQIVKIKTKKMAMAKINNKTAITTKKLLDGFVVLNKPISYILVVKPLTSPNLYMVLSGNMKQYMIPRKAINEIQPSLFTQIISPRIFS